jgi:hypothetical protein
VINFSFNITNPLARKRFGLLKGFNDRAGEYKAWELNFYRTDCLITADFSFTRKQDHAGVRAMIGLLGFEVELHFYDTRHWDNERNDWENYV